MSSLNVARELWRELDYVYSVLSIARDVRTYVTGLFREANTPAKHAHLMVAFLSGVLPVLPDHGRPPDQETDEIAADLIALNRAGFLTTDSQPASPNKKAFVCGCVDARWVPALREALLREGDLCFFFEGDPEREDYVVTRNPEHEGVTTLGCDPGDRTQFEIFFPHQAFFATHVFAWVAAKEAGGITPHPAVTVGRILVEVGAPPLIPSPAPSLLPIAVALHEHVYASNYYLEDDEYEGEDEGDENTAVTAAVRSLFERADTTAKFAALNVAFIRGVLPMTPLHRLNLYNDALSDGLVTLNLAHGFLTMDSHPAETNTKAFVTGMVDSRHCGGLRAALLREPNLYFYMEGFTNAPLINNGYPIGLAGNLWCEENDDFNMFPHQEFFHQLTFVWVAAREFGTQGEHPVIALVRILQQQ